MRLGWVVVFLVGCSFSNQLTPDDAGTPHIVGFERAASVEDEASETVMIPVRLDQPAAHTVSVEYEISDGSATRGDDYTATNGRLTFGIGDIVQYVPVTIIADGAEEGDETIDLRLKDASGATLGLVEHTLGITADIMPRVRFTTLVSNGLENQATVQIVLELDPPSANEVTVDYQLTGLATAADYNLAAGTVVFPATTTMKVLDLAPIDDLLDEDPETVVITLANPQNAIIKSNQGVRTHTLDDDDATPTIRFTQASSTTTESGAPITLTVQLSAVSGRTVTVPFTALPASTNGASSADYTYSIASPLVIPAGTQSMSIVVTIVDDTLDEFVESFSTVLGTPMNADLAATTTSHALSINDNDVEPSVSFDPAQANGAANEGNNGNPKASYKLKLSAASGKPITVPILYSGSADTNGLVDYTAPPSVTFAPGASEVTLTLDIVPDVVPEFDETVVMDIPSNGSLTNVTRGSPSTRTHTILNDDL